MYINLYVIRASLADERSAQRFWRAATSCRLPMRSSCGIAEPVLYRFQMCFYMQVMEGIAGGRGEYAAILADRGFLPASYAQALRHGAMDMFKGAGGPDQYSGK